MRIVLTTIILVSVPVSVVSAISYDNPINSYDKTYCSALEMIQTDQNLNE